MSQNPYHGDCLPIHLSCMVELGKSYGNTFDIIRKGGGRNVDDQNVDRPKISERRNGLFSWSERRNQNVENVFWVDQNSDN